jgi:hypothetical protein
MSRGTEIHQTCEDFVRGTRPDLHHEISAAWGAWIRDLKDLGARPEEQWAFDCGWHPVDYDSPQMWLRVKIDVHYPLGKDQLHVIDYKTGKPYASNMEQIEVYALGAFAQFDDVQEVIGSLWYLDSDEPHDKTFTRSQAPKLARKWEQRAGRLLEEKDFAPRPNKFCNWCAYNESKGGPCIAARSGY